MRHKFFSAINILGLTIGMACCLIIFIYVQDELSYDRFHSDNENIYRVGLHGRIAGQEVFTTTTSLPLGPAMKEEIPGVEQFLRLRYASGSSGYTMRYEDKVFAEEGVLLSDSNFFQLFSFPLIQGDPALVLSEPNSIVITERLALKYFGSTNAVGKILTVGNEKLAVKVTGIAAETPSNSHFHFQAIVSFETVAKSYYSGWTGNSWETYIRKTPTTQIETVNIKLEDLVEKYVGAELETGLGIRFDEFRKQGGVYSYFIYPLTDSHLYSKLSDGLEPQGDITYVYIFAAVGLFILVIAGINFMNLSTAQSAGRAKEVGLRKTLGSQRAQIIFQFLAESFLYSGVAIALAVGVSYLMLPPFNLLTGKQLTMAALQSPAFLGVVLTLWMVVGLLAGSYPAFYLTSFSPVDVLKGKIRSGMRSRGVRSSLVVFQFAMSTFLIIATVVVYEQLGYMQSKNLGIDKQNVLTVSGARRLGSNMEAFKTALNSLPGVVMTSYSNNKFPGVNNTTVVREKGKEIDHLVGMYSADWDHLETLGMKLAKGRFFSREFRTDSMAAVLNEAAVREYGFDDPLNSELTDFNDDIPKHVKVIGVVNDFNFETLRDRVRPLVILLAKDGRQLMVRYQGNPQQVIEGVERQWKALAPGEPFEYSFLDNEFDALFRSEMRLRDVFIVFSALAIFIACLGLLALAAFTTEQRTKEIGIRKVMGASVPNLALLLSGEFTRLVLIAIVPAVVMGWYVGDWWLAGFAHRVTISPWLFATSALFTLVIAWMTVSSQSIRAATSNPVKSLRYE